LHLQRWQGHCSYFWHQSGHMGQCVPSCWSWHQHVHISISRINTQLTCCFQSCQQCPAGIHKIGLWPNNRRSYHEHKCLLHWQLGQW
jgi:hypothetical protein